MGTLLSYTQSHILSTEGDYRGLGFAAKDLGFRAQSLGEIRVIGMWGYCKGLDSYRYQLEVHNRRSHMGL